MMISTKGRYALRIMIDLAQHEGEGYISLKDIAGRQDVSLKYLEMIAALLNKGRLIVSSRGKEGGYKLAKPKDQITVSEVMAITEGSLAPVACLTRMDQTPCERADGCLTLPMWRHLDSLIEDYLSGISIADLLNGKV